MRLNSSVSLLWFIQSCAEWKYTRNSVENVSSARVPLLLRLRAHLLGSTGLHLALIEQQVLGAIPAGRFFTHADGKGGWRPFKWSTWRLWPVINEFAVSHGSCKETSGKKKKKWLGREGGRVLSLEFGTGYLCQDEKWPEQIFAFSYTCVCIDR